MKLSHTEKSENVVLNTASLNTTLQITYFIVKITLNDFLINYHFRKGLP